MRSVSGTSPCRKLNNYSSPTPLSPTNRTVALMNTDTTSFFPNSLSHTSSPHPLCQLVLHLQRRTILHILHVRLLPNRGHLRASSRRITSRSFRRRLRLRPLPTNRTVRPQQSTNVTSSSSFRLLLQLLQTPIPLSKTVEKSTHTLHVHFREREDGMDCVQTSRPNTRFPSLLLQSLTREIFKQGVKQRLDRRTRHHHQTRTVSLPSPHSLPSLLHHLMVVE